MCRLAAILVLLVACSPGEEDATLAARAGELRVIVLAPSIARVALALGVQERVVGVDEYSARLPGFENVPSIGGLFNPDLERTIELRPTLVLSVKSAQQSAYMSTLRARGVRVVEIEVYTLDEVLASFETIAELFAVPAAGRALAGSVRAEIAAVALRAEATPARTVVLVLERDPLYVAGGGAFTQALLEAAGGQNVFADLPAPYPRVSLEALAERAPELLIDSTVGADGGPLAAAEVREYWSRFSWVREVAPLDRSAVTLPGPELGAGARTLLAVIHPELDPTVPSALPRGSRAQ